MTDKEFDKIYSLVRAAAIAEIPKDLGWAKGVKKVTLTDQQQEAYRDGYTTGAIRTVFLLRRHGLLKGGGK